MANFSVAKLRIATFVFAMLMSLMLLGLCAHIAKGVANERFFRPTFPSLGIAVSILTILTLPAMLILDYMRKGAVTSMIFVEVSWLGILWVLFLTTAARASQDDRLRKLVCPTEDPGYVPFCREVKPVEAFAHLTWLALFGYVAVLNGLSIKLANRGYPRVWYQSVKETDFDAPALPNAPVPMPAQQYIAPQQTQGYYPPQAPVAGWVGTPQQGAPTNPQV